MRHRPLCAGNAHWCDPHLYMCWKAVAAEEGGGGGGGGGGLEGLEPPPPNNDIGGGGVQPLLTKQ